jgi:O-antigen/teichoic acid export membrane protein
MKFKHIYSIKYRRVLELARDPLYRNSFFMAFTNIFNSGCGFLFWMVAARLYKVEEVGVATALVSSLGLVILFSRLGFDAAIFRFFSLEDKKKVIFTSLTITTLACIIAGVVYIMLVGILAPSMPFLRNPRYALLFLSIAIINSVALITGNVFVAGRRADRFFIQNILMALRIPALVPLVLFGAFGIFGSVGIGYFISALLSIFMLRGTINAFRMQVDRSFINKSFRFSLFNYLSGILSLAPEMILPLMVLNMNGKAEAAIYYLSFAIGSLVLIVPNSLGISFYVEICQGEGLKKSLMRAGGASLILLTPLVLILILFGGKILGLVGGDYVQGLGLLRIIAISSFFVTIYTLCIYIQNFRMKVGNMVKLNVLRCALLLGLSYMLMPRYGILGAGYAWITTYGVTTIVLGYMAYREKWL